MSDGILHKFPIGDVPAALQDQQRIHGRLTPAVFQHTVPLIQFFSAPFILKYKKYYIQRIIILINNIKICKILPKTDTKKKLYHLWYGKLALGRFLIFFIVM